MNPRSDPSRRVFCKSLLLSSAVMALPTRLLSENPNSHERVDTAFIVLMRGLLSEWCDAMLALQINNPSKPEEHGALSCPSCSFIHGRCMDAVYPFLHLAKITGNERYLKAGIAVFEWSKNVSQDNGAWTVMPDPKSWKGITVYGAIALAEALRWHADLLEPAMKERWTNRLRQAGDYIRKNFDLEFTNINYGASAIYALHLIGRLLGILDYSARSRELAGGIKNYLTQPNSLLFGEGHEKGKSPRGLHAVDLGYNVEETLNSLAIYALEVDDKELIELLSKSLSGHLEFMLPDGAWDNSWGTRQAKWTYWGSRTTDGCQPAYASMAMVNPAFGAAAYQNTVLLKTCTHGLLHGGPHYLSHGVKPCVHHTFTHAKSLAYLLDEADLSVKVDSQAKLPRDTADGVKEFPEVATWLVARGPWRGTVTAYDWRYRDDIYQPTGGALSMLWHRQLGPLLAGSMSKYVLVEPNNMQVNPDAEDHPLTPRVEAWESDHWFTNLHDLKAEVKYADKDGVIDFTIETQLLSEEGTAPISGVAKVVLRYCFDHESVVIRAILSHSNSSSIKTALVIPVISATGEKVIRISDQKLEIHKSGGKLVVESNVFINIKPMKRERAFNLVPGFEVLPLETVVPLEHSGIVEFRFRMLDLP